MEMLNEFLIQLSGCLSSIEYDLISALFAVFIYAGTLLINQVLGTVMAITSPIIKFDKNKFLLSIVRGILIIFALLSIIVIVDLTPLMIERLGIVKIDNSLQDLITAGEILIILFQAYQNNIKDVIEKLHILFLGSSIIEVKQESEEEY